MNDLKNKVVLITGASTGIGAATAIGFGKKGSKVIVNYNNSKDKANQVVNTIKELGSEAYAVQGDASKEKDMKKLIDSTISHFGELNILINNAGGMIKRAKIEEINESLFNDVFNLNCLSVMLGTKMAAKIFREQGKGGCIINTSSIAARIGGSLGAVFYSSSKAWVSTFTRGMARELLSDNIRVNAIAPGIIDTPFHEQFSPPDILQGMINSIPMGRMGTSEEVAGTYLFLSSEELSSYITGQVIEVNGGQLMP
jgi:3-oxoacyl-[acyl-carrier protein] reductase